MFDYSFIRQEAPSIFFFFARLGVFLAYSCGRRPQAGLFASYFCALRLVLFKLYHLIHQSLILYHLATEMATEIKSSDLDKGFSSSDEPMGKEIDIAVS